MKLKILSSDVSDVCRSCMANDRQSHVLICPEGNEHRVICWRYISPCCPTCCVIFQDRLFKENSKALLRFMDENGIERKTVFFLKDHDGHDEIWRGVLSMPGAKLNAFDGKCQYLAELEIMNFNGKRNPQQK